MGSDWWFVFSERIVDFLTITNSIIVFGFFGFVFATENFKIHEFQFFTNLSTKLVSRGKPPNLTNSKTHNLKTFMHHKLYNNHLGTFGLHPNPQN